MSIETLVRMTAPVRDAFDIPYHDLGDRSAPPRIALVAGLHGNELNGIFVLSRLAAFLTEVAGGARPMLRLRERVVVIPAVNVLGVNTRRRVWPFDGTDLNRMFPGYDGGETTQRIAHAVFAVTAPARYRVDLHSSNLEFEELPQVRLYDPNEEERRTARLFGLPAIIERPGNTIFSATLGHAWREAGGANFVIQAGQAGELQLGHCERVFRGLIAFLDRIGVVEGAGLADDEEEPHHFGPRQTLPVIAARRRPVRHHPDRRHVADGRRHDRLGVRSVRRQPARRRRDAGVRAAHRAASPADALRGRPDRAATDARGGARRRRRHVPLRSRPVAGRSLP